MPVRRPTLVALVLVSLAVTGCGLGLNTGNPRERADWRAADERIKAAEERRIQHEATMAQIRNGTLPPTTTTLPDPDSVDGKDVTTTTAPTVSTTSPVVGPAWCAQIDRFATVGYGLYQSSNPEFVRQAFNSMIDSVETLSTQATAEVRRVSAEMLAEMRTAEAEWIKVGDRVDLRSQLFAWIDAKHGLVEEFLRVSTKPCLRVPIDGELNLSEL